jgi:hypothetical protein
MQTNLNHVREEDLETYAIGNLSGPALESVELHLLVCSSCQDQLSEIDDYVRTMRAAARRLLKRKSVLRRLRESIFAATVFRRPNLALGGALTACAAMLLWFAIPGPQPGSQNRAPAAVLLRAVRGREASGPAVAARSPLRLQADVSGLQARAEWELRIVDAAGKQVRRFVGAASEGILEARFNEGLETGQYWVRVLIPGSSDTPLREFSLRVR